jgi:sterol desaturase/sphingolipid hydroxylase (fatty acid hydroxylase superfamily)
MEKLPPLPSQVRRVLHLSFVEVYPIPSFFVYSVGTPSPISTLYIDGMDATLQGTLPLLVAAIVARAHPVSFWCYCCLRVAENVLNHCGLESQLLTLLSFKFLPGRAAPAFHDYHHRFSNYSGNAKNFGENFVLWDHAFGTAAAAATRKGK